MKDTHTKVYQDFCDNTKITFYLNTVSILLILFFVIGPLKQEGLKHYIIQIIGIALLSYSLYINVVSSASLLEIKNMFVNPNLAIVRNNFALNTLFSIIVFLFIIYMSINILDKE